MVKSGEESVVILCTNTYHETMLRSTMYVPQEVEVTEPT